MTYMYIYKCCKSIKTNNESRVKSVVSCYIKKQSLQVVSNRLVRLTNLIRILRIL